MAKKKNKQFVLTNKLPGKTAVKYLAVILVIFMAGMLIFKSIRLFMRTLPYSDIFKLRDCYVEGRDLKMSGRQAFDYCGLSGAENLLGIDLEGLRDRILKGHPQLKGLEIKKQYPDILRVDVEPRIALAQIKTTKFLKVDEEGFVLEDICDGPSADLPLITGINQRSVKEGAFSSNPDLKRAIEIVKLLEAGGFRKKYGTQEINVANSDNISFYINKGVEIKLGKDRFEEKIKKLEGRLPDLDLAQIAYIDLRFRDLIVGPK